MRSTLVGHAHASRFVLAVLLLGTVSLHVAPTAIAERCYSNGSSGYCITCPGPGYHYNCNVCYWSDGAPVCRYDYGCEYDCGECEPGQTQGEVYECRCQGNANCQWHQTCNDTDGDGRCDGGGGNASGNEADCDSCANFVDAPCANTDAWSPRDYLLRAAGSLLSTRQMTVFEFGASCG